MTPALLFALDQQHWDDLGLASLPVDKLAWMYANANRDQGETGPEGQVIRPPAPAYELDIFRTFAWKAKSLAAKDGEWDYSLQGAKADKAAFKAWSDGKLPVEYIPRKPKEH